MQYTQPLGASAPGGLFFTKEITLNNKKTGAKINGGARPGAGRKPDWLKQRCATLIDKHKLLEYVARVAAGEETQSIVTKDGEVVDVACSTHDRLHAFDLLMERGFGKPVQGVELAGKDGAAVAFDVVIKVAER